jgi:hypothetical protein
MTINMEPYIYWSSADIVQLAAGDARRSQKLGTAMLNGEEVGLAARAQFMESK